MATSPFGPQTAPRLADLEARLVPIEDAVIVLPDGVWIKPVSTINGDGETEVEFELLPVVETDAELVLGSAAALTSGVAANVVSLTLTKGFRWRVEGQLGFTSTGTAVLAYESGCFNTTSATLQANKNKTSIRHKGAVLLVDETLAIRPIVFDLTAEPADVPVYLVAQVGFAGGTGGYSVFGYMSAERRP